MAGRGGRGGGFGRGGGAPGARGIMQAATWQFDPEVKLESAPTALFPPMATPVAKPLAADERKAVAYFRSFRNQVHAGPLYTVLKDKGGADKTSAALADPFESMPTYTMRYRKQTRKIPRLDTRPYVMEFFPEELWSTIDPTYKDDGTGGRSYKRKKLTVANGDELLDPLSNLDAEDPSSRLATLQNDDEEDEGEKKEADPDEEQQEEEVDDDFEDDEEEMGGDYDAEQYFEDGADDYDDYGDAGGDDEGGYYG